ncbi:hypothetical protein [Acinetobacter baumannii]|nr:hypothetical protein [Acinetobacter baumannii]
MTTTGLLFIFAFVALVIIGLYNAFQEKKLEDMKKEQQQLIQKQ